MPTIIQTKELIKSEKMSSLFSELYGNDIRTVEIQQNRYLNLLEEYSNKFGNEDIKLFSSPGRTEIGGNHTDHNYGKVLAASITLDCIAVAGKNDKNIVVLHDTNYNENYEISLRNLEKTDGENGSKALVRGMLSGFKEKGYNIEGFNICVTSNVISAAGISSSASFEMMIATVVNELFNEGKIDKITKAKIGQYAENKYWDKQSGLLDQMACGYGGLISIDFRDREKPVVEEIKYDFSKKGYNLMIVCTGGNHADLSKEYSAIPSEMKAVAKMLGGNSLRDVTMQNMLKNMPQIRKELGDRATMRAFHYFEENIRVDDEVNAMKNDDFEKLLNTITESGNSSWKWLQNCYCIEEHHEQSIPVALAMTEIYIKNIGKTAACRVHGGGFAGVILAIIPAQYTTEYIDYMEAVFGKDSVHVMNTRDYGAICLNGLI